MRIILITLILTVNLSHSLFAKIASVIGDPVSQEIYFEVNKKKTKGMTKITKEEVRKVAELARLELNENEINNHAEQLEKILEYIKQLEEIDTNEVPCTTRAIEVINVFRKDKKQNFDCKEELLDLAPSREDEYFKVPKILNE